MNTNMNTNMNVNMNTNNFNQNNFEDWVKHNHYDLVQLFDCFQYNFIDVLPHTENEWKREELDIFDVFCQFIYEYSE